MKNLLKALKDALVIIACAAVMLFCLSACSAAISFGVKVGMGW